jgi:chromodomain-helicase-DNA-binding protein 7
MRLDGTSRAVERQDAINYFNSPYSLDSAALICTKGLGVGTNFAAADRVIGYDGHGNPQNDIQAAAYCITVGRAKQITMYRLMTAEGWERATLDYANDTTMAADLERLLS